MIVYRSGYFNKFNDELVIMKGYADWGEEGHFLGQTIAERNSNTPHIFYPMHVSVEQIKEEIPSHAKHALHGPYAIQRPVSHHI